MKSVDQPDDMGINEWLRKNYGETIDGKPLFRLVWSTGMTEFRKSNFIDYYGEIIIRDVIETREVPKYPMAQDRWVIERIMPVADILKEEGGIRTDLQYIYNEVYIFQDKEGNALPLNLMAVEAAMYLFFKFYLTMTHAERIDMRMKMLAERDLAKRNKTREKLGEGRSPIGFVLESIKS